MSHAHTWQRRDSFGDHWWTCSFCGWIRDTDPAAERRRRAVDSIATTRVHLARRLGEDVGDGLHHELSQMAAYADLLRAERDRALDDLADLRTTADGYLDLIHAAVRHHLTDHADCHSWESQ